MLKVITILLFFSLCNLANSSIKDKIISQMKLTNNLSFNFIQTINVKSEDGKCIIEYPKKIWCEYNNVNKKIIVSNGKSLVIKNINSGNFYIYPLKKTPLFYLLDKEYLISKMNILKPREIENRYINFKIFENNNEINIFFDKKNLSLVGWQTEDIYQNLAITFISSVKRNQKINDRIFILPKNE
jgi:outer membrane lipoprotein-sorting protein